MLVLVLVLLLLLVLLVLALVAVGGWDPLSLEPQVELSLRVLGIRNRPIQPSSLSYALHSSMSLYNAHCTVASALDYGTTQSLSAASNCGVWKCLALATPSEFVVLEPPISQGEPPPKQEISLISIKIVPAPRCVGQIMLFSRHTGFARWACYYKIFICIGSLLDTYQKAAS